MPAPLARLFDGPVHYPLGNGHCDWSIPPVGEANGGLLGTASWQQPGYTRVGAPGQAGLRVANGHRGALPGSGPGSRWRPGGRAPVPGPGGGAASRR